MTVSSSASRKLSATVSSPSGTERRAPANSTITNYFLIILLIFGFITLYVNLQHGGLSQLQSIEGFQSKHFEKAALKPPKADNEKRAKRTERLEDRDQDDQDNAADDDKEPRDESGSSVLVENEVDIQNNEDLNHEQALMEGDRQHKLAGLNCAAYGGPKPEVAQEMVYWEDIPSDNRFVSPFHQKHNKQYLTFESDHGGWNNLRMAMETVLSMAVAMGRTLVLPPEQDIYLLFKGKSEHSGQEQRKHFTYTHFFHMESIAEEHLGLEVITMDEFLRREGLAGNLRNQKTGEVLLPPRNKTQYDGDRHGLIESQLEQYLRTVSIVPDWSPDRCIAAFPTTSDPKDIKVLQDLAGQIPLGNGRMPEFEHFVGKPSPVDSDPLHRIREMWAQRSSVCIYTQELQQAKLLHFSHGQDNTNVGARLLTHFYCFLFFEDWRQDLWMKRFIRDHVRYIDEIQCAAARVIGAIRERARLRHPASNPKGDYDAFHIRRGDFQYQVTRFEAPRILKMSQPEMTLNATVYIATDERDKSFFKPLMDAYDVVFLDDFKNVLKGVNSNYFGMIDSLIASRSRIFFGCWFSTFTGYINRLRGYHANREKSWKGYDQGLIPSYYYALEDRKYHMQEFYPVKKQFYAREFPAGWREIDKGIGELQHLQLD